MFATCPGSTSSRRFLVRALLCGVSLASVLAVADLSSADEGAEEKQRRAQEIIRSTMSPFCPGRTIDSCPSPYAGEWRDDIRDWVDEGVETGAIRERLKKRAPDTNLSGAPSTVLDGILPVLAAVAALLALVLILRALVARRRRADSTSATKPKQDGSDLDARLDDELTVLDD